MKVYKFTMNGMPFTLKGMTDGVKEDFTDIVRVSAERGWLRRFKKGLYASPEEAGAVQPSAAAINFISEEVGAYLRTEEGKKALYRLMLDGPPMYTVTDEDVEQVHKAAQDDTTDIYIVCNMLFEDAFPKKATAPNSPESPPTSTQPASNGAESCSATHSG